MTLFSKMSFIAKLFKSKQNDFKIKPIKPEIEFESFSYETVVTRRERKYKTCRRKQTTCLVKMMTTDQEHEVY